MDSILAPDDQLTRVDATSVSRTGSTVFTHHQKHDEHASYTLSENNGSEFEVCIAFITTNQPSECTLIHFEKNVTTDNSNKMTTVLNETQKKLVLGLNSNCYFLSIKR